MTPRLGNGRRSIMCRKGLCVAGAAVSACACTWIEPAEAHVKWFCAYNVEQIPQSLVTVLDFDFAMLSIVAMAVFASAGVIDNIIIGRAIIWSLDRVTASLERQSAVLFRATFGGFFICLWAAGGIILTPELKTPVAWLGWLQLAMAACFIWRRSLPLAALGICGLYGYAMSKYGLFHLLDYPIFLGSAAYFAMTAFDLRLWHRSPLDIVRYTAALTLMWGSVEKWGYPQWTFPLFLSHPEMAMGFPVVFYMKAAGVVEFSLSFALLGTPLMRRCSAFILASMFTAAVLEFGKIDAIGHAPIIVAMLAIAADSRRGRRQSPLLAPAFYALAVGVVMTAYYGGHLLLFGGFT